MVAFEEATPLAPCYPNIFRSQILLLKKKPLAREVSLEENDRMLQSRFSGSAPRPSQVDVEGSVLDGFLLSKM